MLFFKVITVTLITICAADNRMLLTKLESDQEPSTLQFRGHVLFPKIYKYPKVNKFSSLNSILRHVRSASPNVFQKLQYAPLHDGVNQKDKNTDTEHWNVTPTPTSDPSGPTELFSDKKNTQLYAKSHLEPRPGAIDTKCYAPGYKIEASVSRSPGHNAVYRIIPETIEIKKPVKISDYVKPMGINLKLESATTTIKPSASVDLTSEQVDSPLTLSEEQFVINPEIIDTVESVADKSKRYSPHAKYHRLHLNIARVYSPGQVPPKPAVFPSEYPGNFGRRQPQRPKVYAKPQAYPELNLNTMLYPVKRHRKGYRFRTSILHL